MAWEGEKKGPSFEEHMKKYCCSYAIEKLKQDAEAQQRLHESARRFYLSQSRSFLVNEAKAIQEKYVQNFVLKTLKKDCLHVADDIMNEVLGKRVGERPRSLILDESMFELMRSSILVDYGMNQMVPEKDKLTEPFALPDESEACKVDPTTDNCANCATKEGTVPLRTCWRCKKVKYCSTACQTKHWKQGGHKHLCVSEGAERLPNRGKCPRCTEDMTTQLMKLKCGCFLHVECLRKLKTKSCEKCTA